jgi:hypothetical protein
MFVRCTQNGGAAADADWAPKSLPGFNYCCTPKLA